MLQLQRIIECSSWLENNSAKYEEIQSVPVLIKDMGTLIKALSFVNNQMTIAKREWNQAKVEAYKNLSDADMGFSATVLKDFISARCSEQQYKYDLCERCSRTITHTIDALRTCISALKTEQQYSNYQQ